MTRARSRKRVRRGAGIATAITSWLAVGQLSPEDEETSTHPRLWGVGVTLAAFILYVFTTAHSQIAGDTPDFLLAAASIGVPHAPGYPLLTMIAELFGYLPFGSQTFRFDLVATVCSTGTVALIYATALRLTRRPWASAAAAAALAVTPLFWTWSLVLETFPLNNLIVAAIVYCLVRWHEDDRRRGFFVAAALLFGLGVTNQQTVILMGLAIAFLIGLHWRSLRQRLSTVGWAVLAFVGGLVPYVYVPLAAATHPADNWDNAYTLHGFLWLVERKDYGGTGVDVGASGSHLLWIWLYMGMKLGFLLGILVLVGLLGAYLRERWYFVFSLLAFLTSALAFLVVNGQYNPRNGVELFVIERFYLMPYVLVAPLGAIGLCAAADWLHQRGPAFFAKGAIATFTVLGVVGAGVVGLAASSYAGVNVSNDRITDNFARDMLNELPKDALLYVSGDQADLTVLYAQYAEHVRPDVTIVISPILAAPWYQAQMRRNPHLVVPKVVDLYNLVRANAKLHPYQYTFGELPDTSLKGHYYLEPFGLVSELVQDSVTLPLAQAVSNYDVLVSQGHFRPPKASTVKQVSFEPEILNNYANAPYAIGVQYQDDKADAEAAVWFEKALAIAPGNPVILKSLAEVGG